MKKSLLILGLVLFTLILATAGFWLYEARYLIGRASTIESDFSPENSYLFVSPLSAVANDNELIRISVFILNNKGLGVAGKKIELEQDPNLKINTIKGLTDEFGRAVFDVSASRAGEYYLSVYVNGSKLQREAHLSFR